MMFDGTLKRGFEALPTNMSVYNAFVQANLGVVKVYITKAMRLNGGCVLAPYQITRGSLPSIGMSVNGSGVVVSDLALGSLQIGAQTTVGQFSQAIIANNAGWQVGDQLTFFLGRQTVDSVTSIPRATLTPNKVVMDVVDETPLWNVCGQEGFTSVQGSSGSGLMLGMNAVLLAGAAAWVHSREAGQGQLKVSTQFFYVENAALAINTGGVYLQPSVANGTSQSGGNTASGNDNVNDNENQSGGTTGGNTGSVTPSNPSTGDNTGSGSQTGGGSTGGGSQTGGGDNTGGDGSDEG